MSPSRTKRFHGDDGASLVEYALLISLILVVCLAALMAFGDETGGLLNGSADSIADAAN